jgi:dihydrofolate synthase/folylpolyglutamate synthase
LAQHADHLTAVSIPGEANTLPAEVTAQAAVDVGMTADTAQSVLDAVKVIQAKTPNARILICGSLYLAGAVLREHA